MSHADVVRPGAPPDPDDDPDDEPGEAEMSAAQASALHALTVWASRSHVAINRVHQAMRAAVSR